MEKKKHIIFSKDKKEVRGKVWKMLEEGYSKNETYVELSQEYQSDYELASLIAITPDYDKLPELRKKNNILFRLLCIVCALRVFYAVLFLLDFILDKQIVNKGIVSLFMVPLICLIPLLPMYFALQVKRMDGGIYLFLSIMCIVGVSQLFREYPETGFGWIWVLFQLALIVSIGLLSYRIYKKYFSKMMSFEKDDNGNYVFG